MINKIKEAVLVVILLSIAAWAIWYFNLLPGLTFDHLRTFVESHRIEGSIVFLLVYIIFVITFLPGSVLSVLSGIFFGSFFGFIYNLIGNTLGALVSFYISRVLGENSVKKVLKHEDKEMSKYEKRIAQNGFLTVVIIRLNPLIPFKIPNYFFGFTKIKTKDYVWGTVVGMIPDSFVLAYFGNSVFGFSAMDIGIAVGLLLLSFGLGYYLEKKSDMTLAK